MPEPTVQVPVSLIEHVTTFLDGMGMTPILSAELRATLLQPTQSAELDVSVEVRASLAEYNEHRAAPVSIADMAPGTTFLGETSETRYLSRWTFLPDGGVLSGMGIWHDRAEIDPSTIREVTPPKGEDRG